MKYLFQIIVLSIAFTVSSYAQQKKTETETEKTKPNILFILAEDISTDLECYGIPAVKTPVLNKLPETGIQYSNAYGNNSICSPSRSNMMTGVHQNIINAQHHRSNRKIPLAKPYKPITSLLRDAGYTCILGNKLVRGRGHKIDVNFKHKPIGKWDGETEFGFDPINWKNAPPPNAPDMIKWLEKEKPEVIEQMKQGIEPGFGKISKEYREMKKSK